MTDNVRLPYAVSLSIGVRWSNPDDPYSYGNTVSEGEMTIRLTDLYETRIPSLLKAFSETVADAFERGVQNASDAMTEARRAATAVESAE